MRRLFLPIALVVLLFVDVAAGQDAVNLRPQWREGQVARYHFTSVRVQTATMTARGESRSGESRVETEGEITWRVDRVRPDGGATCSMTLDWMTAVLTGADGERFRNDSRRGSGDAPPVHDLLRAMTGTALTVEVAADGQVTRVGNVEAMRRRAQDASMVPEELDFIESATDLAVLAGAPAEVRPGGTWRASFRWTHDLGHLNHETTFRLVGVEEVEGIPLATVTSRSRPRLDLDRSKLPPTQPGGPTFDVRLTAGESEAQVMFDLSRHEAVGRNSVDSRTIATTIRLPDGTTVNQQLVERIEAQTIRISEE